MFFFKLRYANKLLKLHSKMLDKANHYINQSKIDNNYHMEHLNRATSFLEAAQIIMDEIKGLDI